MHVFHSVRSGILPCQSIETLIAGGAITSDTPFDADQVQPASLDLRLSDVAWRVRASFLPGRRKVEDRIADVAMHTIDLSDGVVLEKGCVCIARLQERLALPKGLAGATWLQIGVQAVFQGIFVVIVAMLTYIGAIERLGAFKSGSILALAPLLAALAAVPLLNEALTPALLVGLLGVSVGALQPWRFWRG